MNEANRLAALGVHPDSIWGDDLETTVYAQAYGHEKTLIFRFTLDDTQPSQSLTTRIVNCFHGLEVEEPGATFPDRSSMRKLIWSTIASIWTECCNHAEISDLDVVIDIYDSSQDDPHQLVTWQVCHERLFEDYLNLLHSPDQLHLNQPIDTIDYKDLIGLEQLGGRGCSTLVYTKSDALARYIFKGIDFRTFLHEYESGHVREEIDIFYRAIELLSNMPPHPNIMTPPRSLVTITKKDDNKPLVCGTLYPFFPNGNLGDYVQSSNKLQQRLPLSRKAQWCYEMTAALAHTHFVAHTYHMDFKLGNMLLHDNLHLVLIDWEQCNIPVTIAAPEIDGTWDVEEITDGDRSTLQYTKYVGPERRNMPLTIPGDAGWNNWNVFSVWCKECPKALELAEVFSLGRSMWMLLRQPSKEKFEGLSCTEDLMEDWNESEDVPETWKKVVQACLNHNPIERMGLGEVLAFWEGVRREEA